LLSFPVLSILFVTKNVVTPKIKHIDNNVHHVCHDNFLQKEKCWHDQLSTTSQKQEGTASVKMGLHQ